MDDSDIDDEEQLRQAIALSLQDQNSSSCVEQEFEKAKELPLQNQTIASIPFVPKNGTSLQEAIDLESDDDGESAQEVQHGLAAAEKGTAEAPNLSTFLGLNRKAMEQERLERRQRKRKASISPPSTQKIIKFSNDVVAEKNIESSKLSQESQLPNVSKTKYPINLNKFSGSAPSNTGPVYLNGTVKKTWALRHPRLEDIKLEEVLQRDDLTLAVLSSFQWDVEWLLKKINTKSTQMTFVMQAEDESVQRQYEQETATMPNLRFCFPSMEGQINCMHSKLMLLSHPTHLRIVIPTGNLMPYDWGETGVMENMVFIIDLPRLPEARSTPAENMTSFGRELVYFLEAMELEDSIVQSLHNFDFSQTEDLAFVHSIGGAHHGEDEPWRRTGFCGLGKAIQELGLKNDTPLLMDMVTSSLGALNLDFLMMLYLAAQGDDGLTGYKLLNSKPGKAKASKNDHLQSKNHQEQIHQQITENFRIYFPTHDSVASSTGGTSCGGTICFQQKWYNAPSFPKTLLRDCKSQRRGLLMHNKVRLKKLPLQKNLLSIYVPSN